MAFFERQYGSLVCHLLDTPGVSKIGVKQRVSLGFCATWYSNLNLQKK